MRYVGFPEGYHETDEAMRDWLDWLDSKRPMANHYSIYEGGKYCGETNYIIDTDHRSASLDIKLFAFARGRGIAAQAVRHSIEQAFANGASHLVIGRPITGADDPRAAFEAIVESI